MLVYLEGKATPMSQVESLVRLLHLPPMTRFYSRIGDGLVRYFRVEIQGLRNVPSSGPVIVIANHSGYAGADAIVLSHLLCACRGQDARILAHRAFFDIFEEIGTIPYSFGLRRATYRNGVRLLRDGSSMVLFPEAEAGNFKSSFKRYQLQKFHAGFVRMALATGAPVVPCLVTGAEESHWNLGSFLLPLMPTKLRLPLPLNIFPLPAKWRIRFLPPLHDPILRVLTRSNKEGIQAYTEMIRQKMQKSLSHEVAKREYIFVPPARAILRKISLRLLSAA